MGRGVSANTIRIGAHIQKIGAAATGQFGFVSESDNTNERVIVEKLVEYLNARGGIAGRKIQLAVNETDVLTGTWSSQAQAVCADLIEDKKVFAIVDTAPGGSDAMAACAARGRTPLISPSHFPFDQPYYDKFAPYLIQPSRLGSDRLMVVYVDQLFANGFFTRGANLGLIRYDGPVFERMSGTIKKRLKRHGLRLEEEAAITMPQSTSDLGGSAAQVNGAILRFRSANVTHVLFAQYAGAIPFLLLPQAESQGWRPAYAFTSNDNPDAQANNAPEAQLRKAVAVGFLPAFDTRVEQDPRRGGPAALCMKLVRDAGISNPDPVYVHPHCDDLLFLAHALPRALELTAAGLAAATAKLGDSFTPALTFGSRFKPGRPDGVGQVAYMRFSTACGCFVYARPRVPVN
jgi:ABC-type branched-subunit amino acid transport system substrate-binding protein